MQFSVNTMQNKGNSVQKSVTPVQCKLQSWNKYATCLGYLFYLSSILWSTDSCQNKVSAEPVSHDHIAGSGIQPIDVTYFLKLTADRVMVFLYHYQALRLG